MADPAADALGSRTRFTSSRAKHDHTYVRVVPRPISVVLRTRDKPADPWTEVSQGGVSCKFVPARRVFCIQMKSEDPVSVPLQLPVSPHVEYFTSGAEENTIEWLDIGTGLQTSLLFPNLAICEQILNKVRAAQNVARRLEDDAACSMWYGVFGTDPAVLWTKFCTALMEAAAAHASAAGAAPPAWPKGVEDQLKGFLVDDHSQVTLDTFASFLQWFGPFQVFAERWIEIAAIRAFSATASREAAEELLSGRPEKAFILRLSDPGFFAVSYSHKDADTGAISVLHFRIENVGLEGFTIETADEELITQPTLGAIIASQSHLLGSATQMPFHQPIGEALVSSSSTPEGSSASSALSTAATAAASAAGDASALAGASSAAAAAAGPSGAGAAAGARSAVPLPTSELVFQGAGWPEAWLALCQAPNDDAKEFIGGRIVTLVEVEANKAPFVTAGGLGLLNALAANANTTGVQRLAVRALCALAAEAKNKGAIVEHTLPALYQHCRSTDEQVQQYSAFIFANLVLNDPMIQQMLIERDCLPALTALAASDSAYVQANTAWVFGNLTQHEKTKKVVLLGGLQALFRLSQSAEERVKKYAFDALGALGIVDADDIGKLVAQVKQSLEPRPVWEINYGDLENLVLVDSGGYGNVYLGRYLHMDVAVKRLKKSQLRDLEAFKVEIGMMSKLRHPNIVLFLGATTQPLAIVTEYMARKSLFDVIHDPAVALDARLILRMIRDAALGMNYLHSLHIIHRDFKSLNLLVDAAFTVKITDFGLSRVLTSDTTMTPHGTYAWRPPEMFRSEAYTASVDVYSYGIVIWELITRRIPFDGLSYEVIKRAVLNGTRPEVPAAADVIIQEVVGLMKACWQADPKMRPYWDDICEGLNDLQKLVA